MSVKKSPSIQRHLWVTGLVQGVGFRAAALREASRLGGPGGGLRGFIRNLPDGRVEAVLSGDPALVLPLAAWCAQGPSSARVDRLEVKEETVDSALPLFGIQR